MRIAFSIWVCRPATLADMGIRIAGHRLMTKSHLVVVPRKFLAHVPAVYLTSAEAPILPVLAVNGINNLCDSNMEGGFESHHPPQADQCVSWHVTGSTPTMGASPDPEVISKNITPSLGVCSFGNCESRRLAG